MEISEKLNIFYRAAIEAANGQSETILKEQQDICRESLAEYEKNKKEGQQTRARVAEEKVRKEINRRVSEELLQLKKEYHSREQQKIEELFSLVEEKLTAYRKTDAYRVMLGQKIKNAVEFADGAEVTVYLDPEDAGLLEALEHESGCVLTVAEKSFCGGIRVVIPSKNVLMDESFAGRIAEEREKFAF